MDDVARFQSENRVSCQVTVGVGVTGIDVPPTATFYSPTEKWTMLAASAIKLEEREFVVDSGASMHDGQQERP